MKTIIVTYWSQRGEEYQENLWYLRKYTYFMEGHPRMGSGCLFIFISRFFHGEPLPDLSKTLIKLFSLLKDDLLLTATEK
jgi:hypothetical protein